MTSITITLMTGAPDALLHVYPGQNGPQECFIALDLRDGSMWADYDGEIGNAIPSTVWHGLVRRWTIPVLQPVTVNALMERIAPLAQRVKDGSKIVWNGSNHVAHLNADARQAEEEIAGDGTGDYGENGQWHDGTPGILYDEQSDVSWWDASDWFADDGVPSDMIARLQTSESVTAIAEELDGDGSAEDAPVLVGLMRYLERMKDEMAKEGN